MTIGGDDRAGARHQPQGGLFDAAIHVDLLHLPEAGRPALLGVLVPLLDAGAFRTVGGGRAPVVRWRALLCSGVGVSDPPVSGGGGG